MKKVLLFIATTFILSCNGRSKEEQKAYVDSLFHVVSCSPTIVAGPYTLKDRLDACDKLIEEYPEYREQGEKVRATIIEQIKDRDAGLY